MSDLRPCPFRFSGHPCLLPPHALDISNLALNCHRGGNNWNYTIESLRTWYTRTHLHFINDGVDFWWNDEGETQWVSNSSGK